MRFLIFLFLSSMAFSQTRVTGRVTCDAGVGFSPLAVTGGGDATAANQVTGNASLSAINAKLPALVSSRIPVDCSGVTQPVSGTFYQATQPVSIATMPTTPVTGTFWQTTQPVSGTVTANAGSGTMTVSAASLPLPLGAATALKQDTGNTSIASIDGKLPALGQALAAGSVPVVLTAAQISTLTPLSTVAVTGTFWQATQPVSGTFWQATQPISAAALPLPSGAATLAKQPALGTAGTASADVITVQGIASMTALKVDGSAVTQPVSGTFYQATQPVSLASVPSHDVTNAGTFAVQAAASIADGSSVTLGAKADAKSTATDTTPITAMSVLKQISASVQSPPSQAVTNAGTFATQSTLAAETTKVIGTVNVSAGQSIATTNAGTFAVQASVADGANVTLGAKADAKSTATDTTAITAMSVLKQISASVQAPPSQAVTNAGTFAVQATITGANPCNYPGATLLSITGATSTTNATQIIALSGSTKIYICSLTVIGVSGTTPAFGLVSGTGSNCASSQTTVLQAWTTGAGTLYAFATPVAVTTAAHALCYKDTGTNPVQNYAMTYVQQ